MEPAKRHTRLLEQHLIHMDSCLLAFLLRLFCQVIKTAVGQVGAIAEGNLAAEDLSRAKCVSKKYPPEYFSWWPMDYVLISFKIFLYACRTQLKAEYLMSIETSDGLLEAIGAQALTEGTYHTPEAISQIIDTVSPSDVVNVSNVFEQNWMSIL